MTSNTDRPIDFHLPPDIKNVISGAVKNVLETLNLSTIEKTNSNSSQIKDTKATISGVIGFVQHGIEGTLTVTFDRNTIQSIMSKMYGVDSLDLLDERVLGGIGEVTNQIFGQVKKYFYDCGFKFKSSIPVIVIGPNHQIFKGIETKTEETIFDTHDGPLEVSIKVFAKEQKLAS